MTKTNYDYFWSNLINKILNKFWYKLINVKKWKYSLWYDKNIPIANYAPWRIDKEFFDIYNVIKNNTLVDVYRLYDLWKISEQLSKINWDVLEVWVWKWWTWWLLAKKLSLINSNKTVYLADTYSWVVKASDKDNYYKWGEHSDTSEELVLDLLNNKLNLKNFEILKWVFPDDTWELVKDNCFSLCHIDVDVYESAKDIYSWIWPKLSIWWMVIYDDYWFFACKWITDLVNELYSNNDCIIFHNLNWHAIQLKIK